MKRYLITLLLIFIVASTSAQVPGYMGKKLVINVDVATIPLADRIASPVDGSYMLFKPSLSVEYTLGKAISLGIFAERVNYQGHVLGYYNADDYLPVKLTQNAYGLTFKNFTFNNSGSVSPLGRYFFLEAGILSTSVSDDGTYYPSGRTDLGNFSTFFTSLGYGRQHIFFDYVVSDFGFKLGLPFGSVAVLADDPYMADAVEQAVGLKWFSTFLFNIYFGIGLIAI